MHVSRFQQASKKNFSFLDFWFQVYAHLIEISPLAAGALGWSLVRGRCSMLDVENESSGKNAQNVL